MRSVRKQPTSWPRCVRLIREVVGAVVLVLAATGHVTAQASGDPKRTAYDALSALVLGDRATFVKATLPTEDVDAVVRAVPPSGDERTRLDEQLERVRLSSQRPPVFEGEPIDDERPAPVGARIIYLTQFGSSLVPVVVVRTADGWRVEPRYWVAERAQQSADIEANTPPMVVKRFMYHLMTGETRKLEELSLLPSAAEGLTRNNNMPGADRGHVAMLCVEMPVARARDGEVVRMPSGARVTAGSSADDVVYVGLLGSVEVPFRLRRKDGAWKVLPEPYFEWLRTIGSI